MPVLGYDIAGASSRGNDNIARGTPSRVPGLGGTITKWHCAIAAIGSPADVKLAVYDCDQGTGDPSGKALVEQVEYVVAVSDDESTPALGTELVESSTWYLLCIIMKNASTLIKYDNFGGDKNYWYKVCVYADQYPDPADAGWTGGAASLYSIWVDYQHPGILGYNIAGVSGSHGIVDQYRGSPADADSIGGIIKRFHAAVAVGGSINKNIKMAVANCAQGDGDPSNHSLVEQIEFEVETGDDEWADATENNVILPDTKYFIAFAVPNTNIESKIKYDAVPGCWYDWGWAYASVFPDPLDVAHVYSGTVLYSIWVDYEYIGVLGYNIVGGSSFGLASSYQGISWSTDEAGGIVKSFHIAVAALGGSEEVKMGIANCDQIVYNPSGKAVLEQTGAWVVEVSNNNAKAAVGDLELDPDTYYYVTHAVSHGDTKVKYDNVPPGRWYKLGVIFATAFINPLPTAFSFQANIATFSIWIEYEEVEGEEFIRSISDDIGITDTLSRSGTFVREAMNTIGMTDTLSYIKIKIRKITGTIGITDIISAIVARVKETDCFGVSRIVRVKAKEKLISAIRKIDFFQHPE